MTELASSDAYLAVLETAELPVLDAGNACSQKEQWAPGVTTRKKPNQTKIEVSLLDSWFPAFPKDFPQVKQLLSIWKQSGVHLTFAVVTCYSVHAGNLTHEVMFHLWILYAVYLQKFYTPTLLLTDTALYGLLEMGEILYKYSLTLISLIKSFRQIIC